MFEYTISQQRGRSSGRLILSGVASCLLHALLLFLFVQFPELLAPGRHLWFDFPNIYSYEEDQSDWELVASIPLTEPMYGPSGATLRDLLPGWGRGDSSETRPPIRIEFGDEQIASDGGEETPAAPAQQALGLAEPQPQGGQEELTASSENPGSGPEDQLGNVQGAGVLPGSPGTVFAELGSGTGSSVLSLPPPSSGVGRGIPEEELSPDPGSDSVAEDDKPMVAPAEVPAKSGPVAVQQQADQPKVFEDKQEAIQKEGTGFFDTKGFPMGQYADLIIQRIKGNWSIPSNLRNSRGRTTLIFFIERDGSSVDLEIVIPSGSQSLDLTAMHSIIISNPFPPLPTGFPGDRVGAKFVFSYNERQ